MKLGSLAATLALVVATLIAAARDVRAADIKVLCSNGFQAVMAVLGLATTAVCLPVALSCM